MNIPLLVHSFQAFSLRSRRSENVMNGSTRERDRVITYVSSGRLRSAAAWRAAAMRSAGRPARSALVRLRVMSVSSASRFCIDVRSAQQWE
jgi:hypothetical protein